MTKPAKRKYTRKSVIENNKDNPSKRTRSKKSVIVQPQTSCQKKRALRIKDLATEYLEVGSEVDEN